MAGLEALPSARTHEMALLAINPDRAQGCASRRPCLSLRSVLSAILTWLALGTTSDAIATSAPPDTLIRNVTIITLDTPGVVPDASILLRQGRIAAIFRPGQAVPAAANIIDGAGGYLIPGLVDSHTHFYQAGDNEVSSYLRYGLTTVFSLGTPDNALQDLVRTRARIDAGELAGPHLYATGPSIGGYRQLQTVAQVEPFLDEMQGLRLELVKVYNDVSQPVFDALVAGARRRHMGVFGHMPRGFPPEYTITHGLNVLAHMEELFFTTFEGPIDEELATFSPAWAPDQARIAPVLDLLARNNVAIISNLSASFSFQNLWVDEDRELSVADREYQTAQSAAYWRRGNYSRRSQIGRRMVREQIKYALIRQLTYEAARRGILLLAGSDAPNPAQYPGRSLHQELRLMVASGLTEEEALRTATVNAGLAAERFFNARSCFGVIRIGCEADLLLLSANPIENIRNTQSMVGVMTDGRWYTREALDRIARPR